MKHSVTKGNIKTSVRVPQSHPAAAEARAVRYCTAELCREDVQIYSAKHDPRGQQHDGEQRRPRGPSLTSSGAHTC